MGPIGFNELIVIFIALGVFLIPAILFMMTQQSVLKNVQVRNRRMSPGEVWLQLIPLFGIVWAFFVVNRIADSIALELGDAEFTFDSASDPYGDRSAPREKPTQGIGLAYLICAVCSIIPFLGVLASLGCIVCWIIYWVKLSEYRNLLVTRRYNNTSVPAY
ncbi:hypothetical protein [Flaviaesturariibacter amylovorans]|uniref:DUF4328 domain-containing protein n=1 Tax=Flaviaesturariibacter amylovorans TaxID=1084520 RepID=A0ABP8GWQ0_9BACT